MRVTHELLTKGLALLLALCLATSLPAAGRAQTADAPAATDGMVRVYLSSLGNPGQLDITVAGSYSTGGNAATALARGSKVTVNFSAVTGSLTLTYAGMTRNMGGGFTLYRHAASGENGLRIAQGRASANLYPGDLQFLVTGSYGAYRLYTIAHVFIEDYLLGVLPYEMGASSPLEALKAQCVSARTYTLRAMQGAPASRYDVVDTTADQMYNGTPAGNARCAQAVNDTRGIIAMNGTAFTATFYTASNGGQIESVRNIWGSAAYDYISVKDDPYDFANPDSRVKSFTVSKNAQGSAVLTALLVAKARAVFGASDVAITGVTAVIPHTPRYAAPSRLYEKLDFEVTAIADGRALSGTLTFDIFDELEDPLGMSINTDDNELWSVTSSASGFTLQSRRYGHGTGLSQRGAMYMAELGYTYDQILTFYFAGSRRVPYVFVQAVRGEMTAAGDSRVELIADTPAPVTDGAACTGIVQLPSATASLPLRVRAAADGDVLTALPHGAAVQVHAVAGEWCLVTFGLLTGYALSSALVLSGTPDGAPVAPTTLTAYGTVTASSYMNMRAQASTSSAIVAQVPAGAVLPLLSISGGWAHTQYGRVAGYVSMSYIARSDVYPGAAYDPEATGAEVNDPAGAVLRMTASASGYAVMTLPQGALVKIKFDDGAWAQVYYAGMIGYIRSSALSLNGMTVEEQPDIAGPGEQYAVVNPTSSTLNLRDGAGTSAMLMAEMPRGEQVIITSYGATWCAVRYRGVDGYCMTQYLLLTGSGDPGAPSTQTAYVTTVSGSLNLRKNASTKATILTTIPRGAQVIVTARGATWCAVTYGMYSGHVMTQYLTFADAPVQPTAPPVVPTATPGPGTLPAAARVTTASGSLNLRVRGQTGATILTTIPRHAVVPVLGISGAWTQVRYGAHTGFVMSVFLTYIDTQPPAVTATPTPTPTASPGGTITFTRARVTTVSGSLNLRVRAQTGAAILTTIPQYAMIDVLARLGTWTQVRYNGITGYVMTTFLTFVDVVGTPAPPSGAVLQASVNTVRGSLNLRADASSQAAVLRTIPQYAVVDVYTRGDAWSRVSYAGTTGYVMSSFLLFLTAPQPFVTPIPGQDAGGSARYAMVTTQKGSLNLRRSAKAGAPVLTTIPQYAVIDVLAQGAVWTQVIYNGVTGHVKTEFLTFISATQPPSALPTPSGSAANGARDQTLLPLTLPRVLQALPPGASVPLRMGCDVDADTVAVVLRGDYVVVSARGDVWCLASYEGQEGYLPTAYLNFN